MTPSANELKLARENGLKKHNAYRQSHKNTLPLVSNTTLDTVAQKYADYLANNQLFQHSKEAISGKLGENLYYACSSLKVPNVTS